MKIILKVIIKHQPHVGGDNGKYHRKRTWSNVYAYQSQVVMDM